MSSNDGSAAGGFLATVARTVDRHHLLPGNRHVLAAVSGGSDSMGMLYALHYLSMQRGCSITVVHINHRLRGRASGRDEDFVREAAWRLGCSCHIEQAEPGALAHVPDTSLEMAARMFRHQVFQRLLKDTGADAVALGHTRDDQAETILMRILRGTGIDGLGGMDAMTRVRDCCLIRPLLDCRREAIRSFLRSHGLTWREDETNQRLEHTRNRIRHVVMPLLEREINPSLVDALVRLGDISSMERDLLKDRTMDLLERCRKGRGLSIRALRDLHAADIRRVMRAWLLEMNHGTSPAGFEMIRRLASLIDADPGTRVSMGPGTCGEIRGGVLYLVRSSRPAAYLYPLPVPGRVDIPEAGVVVHAVSAKGFRPRVGSFERDEAECWIDREKAMTGRLVIRSRRPGDRIRPIGLQGSVSLQDLFVNSKVPAFARARMPVLANGNEILWVPGYRIADSWKVGGKNEPSVHIRVQGLANLIEST